MKPEILRHLASVSTATVTMQLLKRGLRNCFVQGARPLNTARCRFVAQAYTLRFIPMREDLSKVEVLGDPEYPPRKAVEDIPPRHGPGDRCPRRDGRRRHRRYSGGPAAGTGRGGGGQ